MGMEKRKLLLNWCEAHGDLKQWIEEAHPDDGISPGNRKGWTYLTFFPKGTKSKDVLYDIDGIVRLARENGYYLPRDIVAQHNKVVLTAYPDGETVASPLPEIFSIVAEIAGRYDDTEHYPRHGFYGKFGGIYDRPEKGRVLAVYSRDDEALLAIYESLQEWIAGFRGEGFRFDLHLSNGLSAIPRMLIGFDDPEYRHAGATHYRIQDPSRFAVLLEQARQDYELYRFEEAPEPLLNA
jgi:hypothetical protein